jgi:hypothetical protein
MEINKKINLELVGLDGNAFSLMGAFKRQARREKWTDEEIKFVLDECMKGDYDHLLTTLLNYCQSEDCGCDCDCK